ncbi:MAG TPA: HemK/PrmC family methyltransferase [Acidimicrobiales bacterium]|nr:HemK/PrmC family methyltransferase [Acidimicrobiales bacterium]
MTRSELLAELSAALGARHEARFILAEVLGPSPESSAPSVSPRAVAVARATAARRRSGAPLQYLLGHWAFRTLDLLVDPRVLIPRPETEQVVEVVLAEIAHLGTAAPLIVDAGTGSGAIALSLATELAAGPAAGPATGPATGPASEPDTELRGGGIWGIDASTTALAVARLNVARVARDQAQMLPVTLVHGHWLRALPPSLRGAVSLVVANPPYVSAAEWGDLAEDVRREPEEALVADGGSDGTPGLAGLETLLHEAPAWLSRPGAVVMELAPHQSTAAAGMARSLGYVEVRVEPDLAGRPRALVGRVR